MIRTDPVEQPRTAEATAAKRRLAQQRAADRLSDAGWLCIRPGTPARDARRRVASWLAAHE